MNKALFLSLIFFMASACGNTTGSTGPSVGVGPLEIGLHLNTNKEFVLDGKVSIPIIGDKNLGAGLTWDFAFSTVLNQMGDKTNYLVILWQDENGDIREEDYSIGQPFKITFEHDQWVQRIERTEQGNIIVIVQKQAMPTNTVSQPPTDKPIQSNNSFATITCDNDITQVNLRRSPGYISKNDVDDIIYKISCGEKVELLGKNQLEDGLKWWYVSWNGYNGWVADHTGTGRIVLIFNQ